MNKNSLIALITGSALLLAPLTAQAAGTIEVHDGIAGMTAVATVHGGKPSAVASLTLAPPEGEATVFSAKADANGTAEVEIEGTFLEHAGVYTLASSETEVAFHILPDTVDPRMSTIDVEYPTIEADGEDETEITVTLRDRYRNLLPGRPVELIASRSADRVLALRTETDALGEQQFVVTSTQEGEAVLSAIDILSSTILDERAHIGVGLGNAVGGHQYAGSLIPRVKAQEKFDVLSSFEVTIDPPELEVNEIASITIRATDRAGETVEDYLGTVRICAPTDPDASLPGFGDECGEVTFTPKNLGEKLLPLVLSFTKPGKQILRVEDRANPDLIIRGETEVLVGGVLTDPSVEAIEITDPKPDTVINEPRVTLVGVGPPLTNLIVKGGLEDTAGDTDAKGAYSITVDLNPAQRDFTLHVRDESGQHESDTLHLVLDKDVPEITSVTFSPDQPKEGDKIVVVALSEPKLEAVTMTLKGEEFPMKEISPGSYQYLLDAPEAGTYQPTITVLDTAGNEAKIQGILLVTPKGLPTVQNVVAEGKARAIELQWDPVTEVPVTGYRIYVGERPGDFLYTVEAARDATAGLVTGLQPGTLYYFAITAFQGEQESAEKSVVVSARAVGLQLTVTPQSGALQIQWTLNQAGGKQLSSFVLHYGVEPGKYTEKRILPGEMTVFTLRDLLDGVHYYVKLIPVATTGDILSDLAAEGDGMPSGRGFHASAPDPIPHLPGTISDNTKPPPPLHDGAPRTTSVGIPPAALWMLLAASIILFHWYWQRKRSMRLTAEFLNVMEERYHGRI
ncbi:MAG: Ig-like domain-containing protein [Candidatus Peregrinibacteria bacterium]|nr:Ig-like domain-containing protein [Candidatus Peregrinibacteria bacterium]